MMVDLFFIYLRVVSGMNINIQFGSFHRCSMKLSMQVLNEFLHIRSHHKSEVPVTNPPLYLKYDSPMKILISLFRINTMERSRHRNLSQYNGKC